MKIAIFGGTFNPIHNGHINLALKLTERYNFDEILLIPAKVPPHKSSVGLVDEEHRLAMCMLAAQKHPVFTVSDIELKRDDTSYSYYTIMQIKENYPQAQLYFIIGCDMLECFTRWHRYEDILKHVTLLAAAREQGEYKRMEQLANQLNETGGRCIVEHIEPMPISSTEIRNLVEVGGNISEYVPASIEKYIKANKLYLP